MNRFLIWLGIFSLSALLRAQSLEPGLVGEIYSFKEELKDFPKLSSEIKPALRYVARTIHYELPNLPFSDAGFTAKFCVIWSGKIRIADEGSYVFFLESDDGSRLFLDGVEIISNGGVHGMTEKSGETLLKPGDHALRIEYFQNRHGASCDFAWQPPRGAKQLVPGSVLFHDAAAPETLSLKPGLLGEYFLFHKSTDEFPIFTSEIKPTYTVVDPIIDFELPNKPFPKRKLTKRFFARWTGKIRITSVGVYNLSLESDDGSRLFLDGNEVISNGGGHGMKAVSARVDLSAGDHDLKIEYFQNDYGAGCSFAWESDTIPREIVPARVLFH
ncbi:MAG: glycoside hydrolase [Verrucomicrobiales bacterium]|nr:glycoside hydrolase [Verrucomicrobiales bacterium]